MSRWFWRIAEVTLSVCWRKEVSSPRSGDLGWDRSFRTRTGPAAHTIEIQLGQPSQWQKLGADGWVFSSAGVWAAFRWEAGWGFTSPAPSVGRWKRLLVWSPHHGRAELWLDPSLPGEASKGGLTHCDPLQNLTLPFFTALFAGHQGILVHAAAVEVDGQAWLFAGPSGSGKSHWSRQWQERGMIVLDEDRVVLRQLNGQVWAFGTPWHPEPRLCSPQGAPLERIFFLRQADPDAVQESRPAAAATLLLRSAQLPIYDPEGTQAVLDVVGEAATQVRSFLIGSMTDDRLLERLTML